MKNLQSKLKSVSKSLAALSKQVEKLSNQVAMPKAVKKPSAVTKAAAPKAPQAGGDATTTGGAGGGTHDKQLLRSDGVTGADPTVQGVNGSPLEAGDGGDATSIAGRVGDGFKPNKDGAAGGSFFAQGGKGGDYELKGITQTQINPKIGLTFARALRSMLRHDPDVMMVGEVRDEETARIATQSALTGHLVFSTLHTNSAAQSVDRMIDVFPPHQQKQIRIQLASVLKAIISMRLLPRADGLGRWRGAGRLPERATCGHGRGNS